MASSDDDLPSASPPHLRPPEREQEVLDTRFIPDQAPTGPAPAVERARVLAYRLYDVAEEIDLRHAEGLIKSGTVRLRLMREKAEFLELPNPPLSVGLGPREVKLKAGPVQAELRARLFDHGALSFQLCFPLPAGSPFEALIGLTDEVGDSPALEALCRAEAQALLERLGPALHRPHIWEGGESYAVALVEALAGKPAAAELLAHCDLPRLLLGEGPGVPLSREQRADALRGLHSYTDADLSVVDWNGAFVYEPTGLEDIPDLVEIVNAQLLELRYYDALLDRELDAIYDEVNRGKRPWWSLFSGKYGKLRRHTLALLLSLAEFTERVENSIKVIGDSYLARVYETSVRQLRIPDWQASVYRKQGLLAQVYSLLKSEVDTDRLLWLEITVVILILGELLLALRVV